MRPFFFDLLRKNRKFGFLFADPFVWMTISCLLLPPFFLHSTGREKLSAQLLLDHFLNPFFLFALFVMALVYSITHWDEEYLFELSTFEEFRARWYLLNGAVYHLLVDGLNNWKVSRTFTAVTGLVDKRYAVAKLGAPEGAGVQTLCTVELFVMAPLCMVLYNRMHSGCKYALSLEIVVSTLQFMGTICWVIEDVLLGYKNFMWDCAWKMSFSLDCNINFWFGTVFGTLVWTIVPVLFVINAARVLAGDSENPSRTPSRSPSVSAGRKRN